MKPPFQWRVQELARQRGIDSAAQLAEKAKIAPGTATALWYGRPTRADLPTLGRVMKALNCTLSEILIYTPDEIRSSSPVAA